jgi:hypothetical protein
LYFALLDYKSKEILICYMAILYYILMTYKKIGKKKKVLAPSRHHRNSHPSRHSLHRHPMMPLPPLHYRLPPLPPLQTRHLLPLPLHYRLPPLPPLQTRHWLPLPQKKKQTPVLRSR